MDRDRARLMERSVDELRQLLELLDVEVDPAVEDKYALVGMVVAQKTAVHMARKLEGPLAAWRQRSCSQLSSP